MTVVILSARRIRDRQIQDRIREITGQMLRRRNGVRGNALEEKRLAELELREVDLFLLIIPNRCKMICLFSYENLNRK